MKGTSILSLKSWLSKLHLPLPRSPRESQQLLSVLTASFERQLDEAHPPIQSRNGLQSHRSSFPPGKSRGREHFIGHTANGSTTASEMPAVRLRQLLMRQGKGSADIVSSNLESLLRVLDGRSGLGSRSTVKKVDADQAIKDWFAKSDLGLRVLVLRNRSILRTIQKQMGRSECIELLWTQIERLTNELPHTVTFEEAEAISLAANRAIRTTLRASMPGSADRFSALVTNFNYRDYHVAVPDMSPSSMGLAAFHPLTDPSTSLSQFIFLHPNTHGLTEHHFDTLLKVSDLWGRSSQLRVELLKGLRPRPTLSGLLKALKDGDSMVSNAQKLRVTDMGLPRSGYSRALSYVAKVSERGGNLRDATVIYTFLRAYMQTADCVDMSTDIHEIQRNEREHQPTPVLT